ncbi:hypothetical protein PV10_08094 [Exophiala mesophila]|uniref:Esterase n=1 Tax=Exophiala mesophila TaxID=212818 RepID=A0A0D1Z3D1_EXOME|nr:uncharacterized protein PV10_08094 [Exophiala mesophila]KIV88409.1 hypothetical protein PV10_08094 [Exophiala mesophila]
MIFFACMSGHFTAIAIYAIVLASWFPLIARAQLEVILSVEDGLIKDSIDGRIVVLFAPSGEDPLDDVEVDTTPNLFFGINVFNFSPGKTTVISSGSGTSVATGPFGYPNVSLSDVPSGSYSVQAFLNRYETVTRSDGSTISVRFPCGDGAASINGFGSLFTSIVDIDVEAGAQKIELVFNNITAFPELAGSEIGGCYQGNFKDTKNLKHVKIRSEALSKFWGRDMYVGAKILLPPGYDAADKKTRYPVIYQQGHWPSSGGPFRYPTAAFSYEWDAGMINATEDSAGRPTPKVILVNFRHESPYYDDSYAVNTANIGPYGDAINDELIPHLDSVFNTIAEPYARIQTGGSTGGWVSAASVIFRPDLFGAAFSSYPDSMDFHRHQDIELYTAKNAYISADGSATPSIREFDDDGNELILATVAQENHWELTFGTSTRSSLQWDVWNAVFGVQGLNGYPLEPWNKVTGEIYPEAVKYWKHFDLADYIVSNWNSERKLGEVLRERLFIYVGTWDDYFLNEGVEEFQKRIEAMGGPTWANVTILPEKPHGGYYQDRNFWDYIELLYSWIEDHAPDGATPLPGSVTKPFSRGNTFSEVLEYGSHKAAVARQASPLINARGFSKSGPVFEASVGRWDPGVALEAQWFINGKPSGDEFKVDQGQVLKYVPTVKSRTSFVQLYVTGRKAGYVDETRKSNSLPTIRKWVSSGWEPWSKPGS